MEFKDKFNRLLLERGIKKIEVARFTGATKGSISQWSAGETKPGNKYLPSLASLLECDAAWLMDDGQGWDMRSEPPKTDTWEEIKASIDTMPRKEALKLLMKIDNYIDQMLEKD